jgi:hypothetical protein
MTREIEYRNTPKTGRSYTVAIVLAGILTTVAAVAKTQSDAMGLKDSGWPRRSACLMTPSGWRR